MKKKKNSKGKCKRRRRDADWNGRHRSSERKTKGANDRKSSKWRSRGVKKPKNVLNRPTSCICESKNNNAESKNRTAREGLSLW